MYLKMGYMVSMYADCVSGENIPLTCARIPYTTNIVIKQPVNKPTREIVRHKPTREIVRHSLQSSCGIFFYNAREC